MQICKHFSAIDPADPLDPSTDFTDWLAAAGKPASEWSVGPELELFGFTRDELIRISPREIQAVVEGFLPQTALCEVENDFIIEATLAGTGPDAERETGPELPSIIPHPSSFSGRITLEPGGQIEFSGMHHPSLSHLEQSVRQYLTRLSEVGEELGIVFIAAGFDPVRGIREQNWIPKRRYEVMQPYLARQGRRALDMMARTAAVQVNLDYGDLQDLGDKFSLANRLGPVAAAIFANSPFERGRLSGYKSLRYAAWLDTDPNRTGLAPIALEGEFSAGRFIDYVYSVPMVFIRRNGEYLDFTGESFANFVSQGGAIFQDFTDHLTTIFTEARLKPHIEQRSGDCGRPEMVMAALAFWKGLMYDRATLDAALELAPALSLGEFAALQAEVARHGLEARLGRRSVLDLAREAVRLAEHGLRRIAPGEVAYLDVLRQQILREGICPADVLIRNFQGSWNGDIRKAVEYLRIDSAVWG